MDEIGRAVSRKEALRILRQVQRFVPEDLEAAYMAAFNRVRYELNRHEPVEPKISNGWTRCGNCGEDIRSKDNYCPNCGKEIKREYV